MRRSEFDVNLVVVPYHRYGTVHSTRSVLIDTPFLSLGKGYLGCDCKSSSQVELNRLASSPDFHVLIYH